jgi:hypothetical protein
VKGDENFQHKFEKLQKKVETIRNEIHDSLSQKKTSR